MVNSPVSVYVKTKRVLNKDGALLVFTLLGVKKEFFGIVRGENEQIAGFFYVV